MPDERDDKTRLHEERAGLLEQLNEWLDVPMAILGFVWLVLLILELTRGLPPLLDDVGLVIWIVFIVEFLVRFLVADQKLDFLKGNWLTALSLIVPAFRVFRFVLFFRVLRATRGLQLIRVVGTMNRGMRALRKTMRRRGLGYVLALTTVVIAVGAAGMLAFERAPEGEPGLDGYGDALWWTSMVIITVGSDYWPRSPEGRVLCLALALYGFAVFGYITASFASFFIDRDAESDEGQVAGRQAIDELRREIQALRAELTHRTGESE